MSDLPACPKCNSTYTYENGNLMVCPECFHEWNANELPLEEGTINTTDSGKVIDAHGNELQNGDAIIVLKDLPVKGSPRALKAGTKIKNIRLTTGDHNIDCKIEGFGAMALKSVFVRKA